MRNKHESQVFVTSLLNFARTENPLTVGVYQGCRLLISDDMHFGRECCSFVQHSMYQDGRINLHKQNTDDPTAANQTRWWQIEISA